MALFCRKVNRHDADIGPAVTGKARKAEAICYVSAQQWLDSFGDGSDLTDLAECFSELWKERKKVAPRFLRCGSFLKIGCGVFEASFLDDSHPAIRQLFLSSIFG